MLKGVNRHIVEINNPQNEYFEKAILYIKQGKLDIPPDEISIEAREYLASLGVGKRQKSTKTLNFTTKLLLGGAAAAAIGVAVTAVLMNM